MHKRQQKQNSIRNHHTRYNVVHPQCRGYVHKLCSIQLATKPQFDLRTQLQVFPQSFLQNPSAHTAAEVIHAHSWDLTFPYKSTLLRLNLSLHQKS